MGEEQEPKIHDLKIFPEYFEQVESGFKPFEIRKDDRGFKYGDILNLREWDGEYTGRSLTRTITYLTRFEQQEGFVVLGLSRPTPVGVEGWRDAVIHHIESECRHPDGSQMMDETTFFEGARWLSNHIKSLTASQPRAEGDKGTCQGYMENTGHKGESIFLYCCPDCGRTLESSSPYYSGEMCKHVPYADPDADARKAHKIEAFLREYAQGPYPDSDLKSYVEGFTNGCKKLIGETNENDE